ncbi:SRPBCC family protein [Aureitalea sp. L0-47]|uniref:SRPBCC family protein n=1 Tax=Aureitalea sp. L0-47 TaxID=2816962 RepID=UPI0022370DD4|nr:SRPBCC family protein [Aureitalea sp. L0-47]MCW5519301.1 SRPBCC family protein [Aureitalea sp. L0-47]
MQIESRKVNVQKSAEDLCTFLSNVENFEQLMPENISKFELLSETSFVFALKGMPEIGLEVKEVDSPNKVSLGAISDKIPFDLSGNIEETGSDTSKAILTFNGDFNPMMAMMIKGPITKFLETLVSNMEKL